MRKFAIIILSIISFTSCSSDDVVAVYPSEAIGFRASAGTLVRTITNDNFNHFTVWAIYNRDGATQYVMDGLSVDKQGGEWSYGSTKYWPIEGNIDFLGLYPSSEDAAVDLDPRTNTPVYEISQTMNGANREIQFAAKRTNADMNYAALLPDLIYAVAEDQTKENSNGGEVAMRFRHAMSQVRFEIKNENPMWTIKFRPDSAIVMCNIRSGGVYTLPSNSTNTDNNIGEWSFYADQHQHFTVFTGSDVFVKGMTEANQYGYIRPEGSPENENAPFMKDKIPATVLPCEVVAWDPTSGVNATAAAQHGAYFVVYCRVEAKTSSMLPGTSPYVIWGGLGVEDTDESYYKPIYVPINIAWEQGYKYKYTIAIGKGLGYNDDGTSSVVPLSFDVTGVESFGEQTPTDMPL